MSRPSRPLGRYRVKEIEATNSSEALVTMQRQNPEGHGLNFHVASVTFCLSNPNTHLSSLFFLRLKDQLQV
jgi:hypothetical protein